MSAAARSRWSRVAADLDRINHILIPATKEERDRWRTSRPARALRWLVQVYERFTEDGQLLFTFTVIAAALGVDVKRSEVYVAWACLSGILLASWLVSFFFRLTGVKVEVRVPRHVTVGEETTFSLAIHNDSTRPYESVIVRGPFLPWDGAWTVRRAGIARLAEGAVARVELQARFRARGAHHLDPFRLQAVVPFGLALGPALRTAGARFLVVPRVANVTSLSLPQGRRHQPGGVPRASRTADSRELLGVRPYRFGDSVRDLHARTWARIGVPAVREYREEYFSRVGVVLDTDLADSSEAAFEAAVSLVAGVIARLAKTEALVDVIVLGIAAHDLTVGRSVGTLDQSLELLATVRPEGAFDEAALGARVLPRLSRLSSLVFVALAWDEPRRAFVRRVRSMGATCTVLLVSSGATDADVVTVPADLVARGGAVAL